MKKNKPKKESKSKSKKKEIDHTQESLVDFLRRSPLMGLNLVIERKKDPNREINLE